MTALVRAFRLLSDPFGFSDALAGLALPPGDLPSLTRERRLDGGGL